MSLQASTATPQLKYLAKVDFTPVKIAATKALVELGELIEGERERLIHIHISPGELIPTRDSSEDSDQRRSLSPPDPITTQSMQYTSSTDSASVLQYSETLTKV